MNNFWKDKKVLVTGGAGFVGSHLVEQLVAKQAKVSIFTRASKDSLDFLSSVKNISIFQGDIVDMQAIKKACKNQQIVFNLAAKVGGIEYNRTHQATMMQKNLTIGTNVLEAARISGVERFLVVSSACVYPRDCKIPTSESEGFRDEPESTNGGYGLAKRMAEKLGMYYAEEFDMKIGIVRPYNSYGPRDHFDPSSSHVIPALIKRVLDGEDPLLVWGSGKQTRAFLYVEDLVHGMMLAMEKYPIADPINLGTDEEVTIKKLIEMIIDISGVKSTIKFDTSKPDGSPRRNSDNRKAKEKLGFSAKVSLAEGLKKTIVWYKKNKNKIHY